MYPQEFMDTLHSEEFDVQFWVNANLLKADHPTTSILAESYKWCKFDSKNIGNLHSGILFSI
ncbi:hypothetical protein NEF87_004502 [Candidatus Lokiarchaeum ossiferum]|uniref:Uncharacterized protein n=1 Tax=Candidatus Lokiarchaeum ossiferum TaxID=2951803 RepID=A0ABY6I0V9_9ARCH|nr:hypothetical protein NEF87_004502 [Candidatus Lokiarchaeum sp. B-35]